MRTDLVEPNVTLGSNEHEVGKAGDLALKKLGFGWLP
jgi:hypothetical protein